METTKREALQEVAVLVHLDIFSEASSDFSEFQTLVISAGAQPGALVRGTRQAPTAQYFVGKGKVEEIRLAVQACGATLVIVDHPLSPGQIRNLEKEIGVRVVDRTGLILDIFAQRARTFEGQLQVELAQLQYQASRLVRSWTHLERQKGGIGLRGPGETQIETDRRLIKHRIVVLKQRLEKVQAQRAQGRKSRKKALVPTVALVGYTNAGKSTLFNHLVGERVYVADQLFATLDPTLRRLELPDLGGIVIADTVGFIRNLPTDLVEAFCATLEETVEADLLLHVIDYSDPEFEIKAQSVLTVLDHIGAGEVPVLQVYNKIDVRHAVEPHLWRDPQGRVKQVFISAEKELGLGLLRTALVESLSSGVAQFVLKLPFERGDIRANLYRSHCVQSERDADPAGTGWLLEVRGPLVEIERVFKAHGEMWQRYIDKN
jgi:GTP-binding protein HflX